MRLFLLFFAGLLCAMIWLALLLVTGFSSLALGIGFLAMLMVMGRSS